MPQFNSNGSTNYSHCSLALQISIQNEGYGIMELWQTKTSGVKISVPSRPMSHIDKSLHYPTPLAYTYQCGTANFVPSI
ncbi:MAG: hypothetical protein EZS28_035246 [Streblomastix strix]|uniref:Uncharacterized protein n=1 Tax=Streblomastix strix TaxID=222440 RepID=A0A5J4UFP2_9EUKA|nr:MAG: hypothetical protein EZS28_035246 [Streblomastix strix]